MKVKCASFREFLAMYHRLEAFSLEIERVWRALVLGERFRFVLSLAAPLPAVPRQEASSLSARYVRVRFFCQTNKCATWEAPCETLQRVSWGSELFCSEEVQVFRERNCKNALHEAHVVSSSVLKIGGVSSVCECPLGWLLGAAHSGLLTDARF